MRLFRASVRGLFVLLFTGVGFGSEVEFHRDVYPFLRENCLACHNKTTTEAGLNMETPESMIVGGDSGPAIVPGKSDESLLVEASAHSVHLEMPPSTNKIGARNLTTAEINLLKRWINEGARASVKAAQTVSWQALATTVDPIYTVALTDNGRYVACGRANRIFLYDLAIRQLVTMIGEDAGEDGPHRALVNALAFSPDGTRLASGSFREVKIWKRSRTAPISRAADPALGIVAAVPFPDGGRIAAATSDGALLIIETASGQLILKIEKVLLAEPPLLSVSADGSKVAALSRGGRLGIWNVTDGRKIVDQMTLDPALVTSKREAAGQSAAATALAWAADGESILTADADTLVRVWTLPDNGSSLSSPRLLSGVTAPVTCLTTAPGGKIVVVSEDGKVRIFNLSNGTIERAFDVPAVVAVISPNGKHLAVGTPEGRVLLLDAVSGKPVFDLRGTELIAERVAKLRQTIDREKLEQSWQKAEAAKIEARDKALVDLLNKAKDAVVAMNKKLPEAEKAIPPLTAARVAAEQVVAEAKAAVKNPPDGKTVAYLESEVQKAEVALLAAQTKENDAVAALAAFRSNITDAEEKQQKITNTQTANKKAVTEAKALEEAAKNREVEATTALAAAQKEADAIGPVPLALAFSADSTSLAAGYVDGELRTWSTVSGVPLEVASGPAANAGALVCRPDGAFLLSRSDGGVLSTGTFPGWQLDRVLGRGQQADLFADRVNAVAFSPDGATLAVGSGEPSRSGDITLFDCASGNPTAIWKECHSDTVVSLDFSPDGKQLASGAADKIARIIDIATGEQVGLFEGHTHYVNDVAFRSDGRVLATAGADGVVNSWDLTIGERKKKIEGWTKEVTSLQFIGSTDRLVTSAGDNLVRIVTDAGSQQQSISGLPDFMQAVASTFDGGMIIAGGEDSCLRVWNGNDGKEIVAFGTQ